MRAGVSGREKSEERITDREGASSASPCGTKRLGRPGVIFLPSVASSAAPDCIGERRCGSLRTGVLRPPSLLRSTGAVTGVSSTEDSCSDGSTATGSSTGRGIGSCSCRGDRRTISRITATDATIPATHPRRRRRLRVDSVPGITTGGVVSPGSSTPRSLSLRAASHAPGAALTLFLSLLSIAPASLSVSSWRGSTVMQSCAPLSPALRRSPCASVPPRRRG